MKHPTDFRVAPEPSIEPHIEVTFHLDGRVISERPLPPNPARRYAYWEIDADSADHVRIILPAKCDGTEFHTSCDAKTYAYLGSNGADRDAVLAELPRAVARVKAQKPDYAAITRGIVGRT